MAAGIKPSGGRRWHGGKVRPPHPTRLGLLRTCAALLLLLLGSAPLLASAQDGPLTLSGTALVVSVTHRDGTSQRILGVRTDDGRRIQVQAPGPAAAQAASLVTGRRIRVAGLWMHPEAAPGLPKPSPHFLAASIQAIDGQLGVRAKPAAAAASGVAAAAAVPVPSPPPPVSKQARMSKNELISDDVSVMFIPIAAVTGSGASCPLTAAPMYTVAAVKKAAFEELNPGGVTIGSTFNRCSYNTSRLTMANSVVTPVVQLPCSGTTLGTAWTFSKCDFADFNGYADAAEEALRKKGYKPETYKHKVYLLPPNSCSFVGLGYVGCNGPDDCRVWITADFWTSVNAIAHELGHNLFLAHAGAMTNTGQYDEYADLTGMMGYCCSDRCPNTAHAWQLGWITAQELSWSSMSPGQTQSFNVNSQSLSRLTGVRLTNLPNNDPLFVGYRTRAGGDATATSDIAGDVGGPGRLHIYTAPIANTFDAKMTTKQATLNAAGQSWALPGTRLVVRLVRATNSAAVVTLCRKAGPETLASCQAGLDNDCNGKVGAADAACAPLLRREARAALLKRARLAP